MHETHYFYLEQAESGAELQSIFCLSFSAPLIAHPLPAPCPPSRSLAPSRFIRSPLSSIPFGSVLNWSVPALGRVSFVRSFIRSGWLAGVTPCNRNLHPGSHYLHFNSTRLSPPSLPPPLPNGGYKHKYEFKGPQMTISRITSRTILCILIRSGYRRPYYSPVRSPWTRGLCDTKEKMESESNRGVHGRHFSFYPRCSTFHRLHYAVASAFSSKFLFWEIDGNVADKSWFIPNNLKKCRDL